MVISNATADDIGDPFSKEKVALYFSTTWCQPCKTFYPRFKNLVQQLEGVDLVKVDVEKVPELGMVLNVRSIPTMVFLRNGQNLGMKIGVQNEDELLEFMSVIFNDA